MHEERLREVVIWHTQAQSDRSVRADKLKNDIKDVEPGRIGIVHNGISLLPRSATFTLNMQHVTHLDDTDQPERETQPPDIECQLPSRAAVH